VSDLTLALIAVFASVALLTGGVTSLVLARTAPGRKRLFDSPAQKPTTGVLADAQSLTDTADPRLQRMSRIIPKSPREMGRLQRRLANAGFIGTTPVLVYVVAELGLAVALGLTAWLLAPADSRLLFAIAAAILGYVAPGMLVSRRVSLEAGLALDQGILKAAEELEIAYPALAHELKLVNVETRAGKPRIEALKNFAKRTQVDDVRALVAMLVQTDRFGTSVAQALRTHAEEARIKRRQRAEERAAKLSVKLIFPLVFFLLPAFFVPAVGPAVLKFVRFFQNAPVPGG
jgi:tight adherence protein C